VEFARFITPLKTKVGIHVDIPLFAFAITSLSFCTVKCSTLYFGDNAMRFMVSTKVIAMKGNFITYFDI
jgi:hypothetical protein